MITALTGLVPCDWVWIDNRADADGHSFIPAGWETEPTQGPFVGADGKAQTTARGVAHAYSQRSNGVTEKARRKQGTWATDGGDDRHTQPVGSCTTTAPRHPRRTKPHQGQLGRPREVPRPDGQGRPTPGSRPRAPTKQA